MTSRRDFLIAGASVLAISVPACGGGDSGSAVSTNPTAPPPPPPPSGLPAWLAGAGVLEWRAVPALLKDMDYTPQFSAGLAADTEGTPGSGFNYYGWPVKGIVDYGSMAVRDTDSTVMIMGGGGAGAWGGLDIRGLKLSDDVPKWKTMIPPSPATNLWGSQSQQVPATISHSRMKDGFTPNSRHTCYVPNFDVPSNRMYLVGCPLAFECDSNPPVPDRYNVDSIDVDAGTWTAWTGPGAHPNLPHGWGWDGYLVVHDKVGRKFYYFGGVTLDVFDVASNTWSPLVTSAASAAIDPTHTVQWDRAGGAVDPGRRLLLRIGYFTSTPDEPVAINIDTGVVTRGTLTGTYASAIKTGILYNFGMCFCRDLDCFLVFPDDGFIYTIRYTDTSHWAVDRLPTTGVGPAPHASSAGDANLVQMWSRFQYVPGLNGVVVLTDAAHPPLFLRTA